MSKYNSYSCFRLLEFLDSWYEHDTERINYAQYLLTMLKAKSVKDLIRIYDKVLWKFIVRYNGFGDEELVSETWYNIDHLSSDTRAYWKELNGFLNENIERLFNSQDYSDELAIACFVNLRNANNCSKIRQAILSKSSENVKSKVEEIYNLLDVIENAPNHISPYNIDTNGYRKYKPKYIESAKKLIAYGFVRSIKDRIFEFKNKVSYFPNNKSIFQVVAIIGILLLVIFVLLIFFDFSLITLIVLIGLPGALLSYLFKS